jgi:hypothetical protein
LAIGRRWAFRLQTGKSLAAQLLSLLTASVEISVHPKVTCGAESKMKSSAPGKLGEELPMSLLDALLGTIRIVFYYFAFARACVKVVVR